MPRYSKLSLTLGTSMVALLAAQPLAAQTVSDGGGVPSTPLRFDQVPGEDELAGVEIRDQDEAAGEPRGRSQRAPARPRVRVTPYIEVGQVVTGEFTNGGDVLTYSTVAVGVEASVSTRRMQAAVDARYERRIAWEDPLLDNDIISGVARARYDLMQGLAIEGGALASRTAVDGRAGTADFNAGNVSNGANLYSFYAGPTFGRRIGDIDVGAAYRFGYSRTDIRVRPSLPTGATSIGSFEDSINHAAIASIGMRPGALPIGWRLSGGYERDEAGQLDQRYEGYHGRLDLTFPITPTVALLGGVGYEKIEVSYAQPLLNTAGQPVVDADGRLVSDPTKPRQIAFETDGLIYDAGVLWRPSRRMSLEARVGRRYGDMSYTGSWSWQPTQNTGYQLGLYDSVNTLGRSLSSGLAALPTSFDLVRNQLDGSIGGCAFGSAGGTCLTPSLANASGFAFRNRGAVLSMSSRFSQWTLGAALGYDRRTYVANGLVGIPGLDGTVDETWFATLSASRPIDERTSFGANAYTTYFDSGLGLDSYSSGGSAALSHNFLPRLTGNAAVSVNTIRQEGFNARIFGSALLGMRYSF